MAGGLYGFLKAGSRASLAAGCGLGSLLVGSGMLISQGNDLEGHGLALGSSTVLSGAMGMNFARSRAAVPGVIAVVGMVSALYHGKKTLEWAE